MGKKNWKLWLVILGSMLVYVPAWGQFFSGDDWFHLRVSQVNSWQEWAGFFSFVPGEQAISFYRPLSTQVFFWLGQRLFGLNPWPWYAVVWMVFGYSLWLVYRMSRVMQSWIGANDTFPLWVVFFYGFSASNFTKLYFLSAFQELLMVVMILLALLAYLSEKLGKLMIFFVLGLMSKETAIMMPGLLALIELLRTGSVSGAVRDMGTRWRYWVVIAGVILGYLYLRLGVFGMPEGDSFGWDWSLLKAVNTLMWYGLWSLGAPELLVDYVGSGLRILPRFWSDLEGWSLWVIVGLVGNLGFLVSLSINYLYGFLKVTFSSSPLARMRNVLGFAIGWFVVSLLPVVFMPWHKFTLELTLAMAGIAMGFGWLVSRNQESGIRNRSYRVIGMLFVVVWLGYNLSMNYLTYRTHYSVNRGKLARNVYDYMKFSYPVYPEGKYFKFINDTADFGSEWGSSKQISQAISGSEMFRVIYNQSGIEVFFEDFSNDKNLISTDVIRLSTNLFIFSGISCYRLTSISHYGLL